MLKFEKSQCPSSRVGHNQGQELKTTFETDCTPQNSSTQNLLDSTVQMRAVNEGKSFYH